jgi:predicted  nucleic acid-binding Zn-ribbon protein
MSKQDIEKRLGFAAQGAKAKFGLSPSEMKENQRRIETNIRYEAGEMRNLSSNMRFIKDEIERLTAEIKNTRDIKRKAQLSLKLDAENKKMKDQVAYLRRARQMIQENQADAKSLGITLDPKWSGNFSRFGAKAEMGFLSRVGYAATALTADPADPKSPEYRKQVSEAKAAAKDAITNYKFMRDKVKERLAALDAYVTNAIKVINSATSAKDIEHYVEQLRIAVKSQSMILGASKSPFSRAGAKAKFADAALDQIRNNAAISDKILTLVSKGLSVPQAIDSVLGEGTYKRIGSEVYDELKKAKSSRTGAKAKFAKPQFRTKKLHNGYIAVEVNQGSGWERYDTTHEESWNGIEGYERGYQKAYDQGLRYSGGAWRIPSTTASRPGVKAKFEKEYVLWGLPKGETDAIHQQVLSTQAKTPAQMEDVKKRAAAAGWHSFRVQILDLSKPYKGFARPAAKAKA